LSSLPAPLSPSLPRGILHRPVGQPCDGTGSAPHQLLRQLLTRSAPPCSLRAELCPQAGRGCMIGRVGPEKEDS
jgi:hypothetical protein